MPAQIKTKEILSLRNHLQGEIKKETGTDRNGEKMPKDLHNAFTGKVLYESPGDKHR